MAISALYSAASGLKALSTQIDVIANNLANSETTAFKRQRCNFEDLYYQELKQPGTTDAANTVSPSGIFVGLGTRISNTELDFTQGSMTATDNPLDVAIQGNGFFAVKTIDSIGGGTAYARAGNFIVNSQGQLVLGVGDGYTLIPSITIPTTATSISIATDGTVQFIKAGANVKSTAGQIKLTMFPNQQGLNLLGGSLYTETEASGKPTTDFPGVGGAGTLVPGYTEASNVDPVKELVTLIQTQRAFDLNSQSIQAADQALQVIGNLRKG